MVNPLSLTTTSIKFDTQRLNTIANNAANVLTPGYKREFLVVDGQFGAIMTGQASASQPNLTAVVDSRPGVQRPTSNPLDLSLIDKGYFEVMTNDGYAYTRQGSFKLDDKGKLVTDAGYPVSGLSGDIYLTKSDPTIDSKGQIFENGKLVSQIKIVDFDKENALIKIGGGLFMSTDKASLKQLETPRVAQGSLESSNVDSTQEMVRLMETFRHFEMSHKVIQAYDELNDKTLKNLSQF